MMLNSSHISNNIIQAKQQGSALMLALFVIIVLTLLGSSLVKILSTSSESIAQEVIGTRALMAANSAMQAELQQLFPLSVVAGVTVVGTCNAINNYDLESLGSDIEGLYHCAARTSCTLYFPDPVTNINYYRLTSTGECGSGSIAADSKDVVKSSRTIQVEARDL